MVIAVNTRLLLSNRLEGIGWFTFETMKRITRSHPEHRFIFLFDRAYSEEFIFSKNITPIAMGPQSRHPLLWYYWFERTVPCVLKEHKADLFLSPDGYLSLRSDVRSVAVIHDLNFEHYPEDVPFIARKYYRKYFPAYAQRADRIATVSDHSKQDIIRTYGIDESKIDVVHDGANEMFAPVTEITKKAAREKYAGGSEYFVYVGSLHPRKNIARLLRAFDAFRHSSGEALKLVIVGEKMFMTSRIRDAYQGMLHKHDVVFTGRLQNEELRNVLASALALTYVSTFEGFGIPVLEAMCCDVPVITSDCTSMPEVAGSAALLADPFSEDSIKDAMQRVAAEKQTRERLIAAGRVQREKFSWDRTAGALWSCMEKALA